MSRKMTILLAVLIGLTVGLVVGRARPARPTTIDYPERVEVVIPPDGKGSLPRTVLLTTRIVVMNGEVVFERTDDAKKEVWKITLIRGRHRTAIMGDSAE